MRCLLLALTLAVAVPVAAEPSPTPYEQTTQERIGPSCFWCSQRHMAPGHEYRYRLMEIGVVVGLLTGWFMVRTIKKANADRAARATLPSARTETH
jgi:hypothetical protein